MADPAKDGFDLDEFFAEAKPTIGLARICPRGDLLARFDELNQALAVAVADDGTRNKDHQAPGIADELKAVEAEIEASMRTFRFQSIGRYAWNKLKAEHPYVDTDGKPKVDFDPTSRQFVDFDTETFIPAAIVASSLAPKITTEQAAKLADTLNDSQFGALWEAVIVANLGVVVEPPKSHLASAVLQLPRGDASDGSSSKESRPPSEKDDAAAPLNYTSTTTPGD